MKKKFYLSVHHQKKEENMLPLVHSKPPPTPLLKELRHWCDR